MLTILVVIVSIILNLAELFKVFLYKKWTVIKVLFIQFGS